MNTLLLLALSILAGVALSILAGVAVGLSIAYSAVTYRAIRRRMGRREAHELARDVLPRTEFERLQRCGYVEAIGASGNGYRIRRGKPIEVVGRYNLCVSPLWEDRYPEDDLVVMYYLYVTADEERFLQTANPIPRCYV